MRAGNALEPLLSDLKARGLVPRRLDDTLPPCPLCRAPAVALSKGGECKRADTGVWPLDFLEHDCDCLTAHWEAYQLGVAALHRQARHQAVFRASLPARYRGMVDAPLEPHAGNREALKAARTHQPGRFFYLFGAGGLGKTHLALRTAQRLIDAEPGAFYGAAGLLEAIRQELRAAARVPT